MADDIMTGTDTSDTGFSLRGQMLIAMPAMRDPNFSDALIYICGHDVQGALGLIVNRPLPEMQLSHLLKQLSVETPKSLDMPVHLGGPVEMGRGFVLHSADYCAPQATLKVDEHVGLTDTIDILRAIAAGRGPAHSFLALGYAGWGPGQLEQEISENGWLHCKGDPDLIFGEMDEAKYARALRMLGVSSLQLSDTAGHG